MMASSARIEELEKKFNENPRRYFAPLANEYRKAGDVQQAIAICRTYVPQQPGHMSGHIVFGQALFEAGDHDEARGVFEAALGLDPENLIALRHLGDIAREHGETDDARAWYRRVLDADPRNDDVAALLMSLEAEPAPASEEPATWMEINPEQTLELPPDILAAVPREMGFASGPPRTPATPAGSMGELFGAGAVDVAPSPDPIGAATLEFRSSSPYAGVADGVDEAAKTVPAFVTETMAELYVHQGFYDRALSVYRQLIAQHPGDPKLAERMEQLRRQSAAAPTGTAPDAGLGAPMAHAAPSHQSVREFFSELALRQPKVRAEASAPVPEAVSETPVAAPQEDHGAAEAQASPAPEVPVVPAAEASREASAKAGAGDATATEPVAETVAADVPAVSEPVQAAAHPAHDDAGGAAQAPADSPAEGTSEVAAGSGPEEPGDAAHPPGDLDIGFSDESYHETYSAEFGASALTIPPDSDVEEMSAGAGLIDAGAEGSDGLVVRQSGEADPFSLLGFGSTGESSEFDVTAYEGSGVSPSADAPIAAADDASQVAEAPVVAQPTGAADAPPRPAMQTGSVDVLFPQHPISAPDEAAAAALSGAFGGIGGSLAAEPTPDAKTDTPTAGGSARPALNELSLDSVFRESPAATPDPRRETSAFSFDQFFGETPQQPPSGRTSGADALLGDALDVGSADAEQFSNWLSGLKKK
jgi:tetratricopeptide (TPR) repeat protein